MSGLSLIVPAYNAEKVIESSLKQYFETFSREFQNFEIIVVCNACTDNTSKICTDLSKKFSLKVIEVPQRGKGNALIRGFQEAKFDIIGFLDADNPFDLNEILKMLNYLNSYDMVIVTKFKKALEYQTSISRRFFSIAATIVFRFLFGLKFKDTQAGAKFMKKELLDKFKRNFVCRGFEIDMELLYRASNLNAKIKEYHLLPNESDFSTVKARILPGIMYRLLKLRLLK